MISIPIAVVEPSSPHPIYELPTPLTLEAKRQLGEKLCTSLYSHSPGSSLHIPIYGLMALAAYLRPEDLEGYPLDIFPALAHFDFSITNAPERARRVCLYIIQAILLKDAHMRAMHERGEEVFKWACDCTGVTITFTSAATRPPQPVV